MSSEFFFSSNNAPNAKVILNRNSPYKFDITKDILSFNTSNDVNSAFGSFTVVIDNTNDKHIDRFGFVDVSVMSSVEIFVKSNIAESNKSPNPLNPIRVTTKTGDSLNSLVSDVYGITSYSDKDGLSAQNYQQYYLNGIIPSNPNKEISFVGGSKITLNLASNISSISDNQLEGGQSLFFPARITDYKRIFLGVVTNVQQSFSAGGAMAISITGESFGYWLKASTVNISPGQNEVGTGASTSTQLSVYANKYASSQALDIFRDLIKFSSNDTLTVSDYSFGTTGTSYESLSADDVLNRAVLDDTGKPFIDKTGESLTLGKAFEVANKGEGIRVEKSLVSILEGLTLLKQSVRNGTYIQGSDISELKPDTNVTGSVENQFNAYKVLSSTYADATKELEQTVVNGTKTVSKNNTILSSVEPNSEAAKKAIQEIEASDEKTRQAESKVKNIESSLDANSIMTQQINTIDNLETQIKEQIVSTGGKRILEQLGIIKHWQNIFSQMVLEVANASYLQQVYPFKWILKSPAMMDGDYQPKSTIAKQIADALNFEFYMDTNGHFVLKPPLYNIGIPDDDPTYILEQQDIISMNVNDTVEGMITRVGVTGDVFLPVQLERIQTYSAHIDLNLVGKYGVHNVELQNLIFLRTAQDCRDFGESYMAKNNQELRNASVTIMGRPDIRLGVACYLKPRDTVYYIKSIAHDFSVGGEYTTTLTLTGARKIVTGYLEVSKVQTMAKSVISGIEIRSTNTNNEVGSISHYVLANSLSASVEESRLNSSETQEFFILKNSYIIISHPNIGYVGLIVDQNNVILSDINYNTFKYIYTASLGATTETLRATLENLQTSFGKNTQPYENIQNFLFDFIRANNLGGLANFQGNMQQALDPTNKDSSFKRVAESFNQAILNQYIAQFINYIDSESKKARDNKSTMSIQTWNATSSYFNNMLMDIGTVGAYRQYTDENGRQYQVLLDYGKGLKVENSQLKMNENNSALQAKDPRAKTDSFVNDIIKAAKQNLGNSSQPN